MTACAVLLAAGASTRMGRDKLTIPLGGQTALARAFHALLGAGVGRIVIAVGPATRPEAEALAAGRPDVQVVQGGRTRGESVYLALAACAGDVVAIHDAARCLVDADTIRRSIESASLYGSGVAAIRPKDTIWQAEGVLDRDSLWVAQTPQSFRLAQIKAAYAQARAAGFAATDDAAVYARAHGAVRFSAGSPRNHKLTCPEDVPLFAALLGGGRLRVGYGEDTHRLAEGRALVLGGVSIPFSLGLLGHSDADALTHAVIDALLGAAALGDIGRHFPDSDAQYKDVCSLRLLAQCAGLLAGRGLAVGNVDATIIAQQPRLAEHIPTMTDNLAAVLGCAPGQISIKATTPEGCGPEGRLECITARCVCTVCGGE